MVCWSHKSGQASALAFIVVLDTLQLVRLEVQIGCQLRPANHQASLSWFQGGFSSRKKNNNSSGLEDVSIDQNKKIYIVDRDLVLWLLFEYTRIKRFFFPLRKLLPDRKQMRGQFARKSLWSDTVSA